MKITMTEKYIERNSQRTYYWTSGRGDVCVLFLHGATADHLLFREQFPFFNKYFRIIAVDIPAHGKSRPYPDFTLKVAADEIVKILDVERIDKVHIIGQSMGGYIAQIIARYYVSRVKCIISIGSAPIQPKYFSKLDKWLLKITPAILKLYPYQFLIKTISNQVSISLEGKKYMLNTLKDLSKSEIVTIMREVYVGIQEYRENISLEIPILLTHGENEKTGKIKSYNQKWAKNDNLELKLIPKSAHNANMDNPDYFNSISKEFIDKTENTVPNS